jgi:hypothetical protein
MDLLPPLSAYTTNVWFFLNVLNNAVSISDSTSILSVLCNIRMIYESWICKDNEEMLGLYKEAVLEFTCKDWVKQPKPVSE